MTANTKKEYAIFRERPFVLIEDGIEKRILDEYGCIVIPNAENGWTDLLDHFVKEGKNV